MVSFTVYSTCMRFSDLCLFCWLAFVFLLYWVFTLYCLIRCIVDFVRLVAFVCRIPPYIMMLLGRNFEANEGGERMKKKSQIEWIVNVRVAINNA